MSFLFDACLLSCLSLATLPLASIQVLPESVERSPEPVAQEVVSLKELMVGLDSVLELTTRLERTALERSAPGESDREPSQSLASNLAQTQFQAVSATLALPVSADGQLVIPEQWRSPKPSPKLPKLAPSGANSTASYPSFFSGPLNAQLRRYLAYVEAVGPADILIVGSLRATQGVDPLILQQALAERGHGGLKVFNWGINGATAQVVDVLLREILAPEQLPKLVIWADGSRSFSSGRRDVTYENILLSPGYRALATGQRPALTPDERQQLQRLQVALKSAPSLPDGLKQKLGHQVSPHRTTSLRSFFIDWCSDVQGPCDRASSSSMAQALAFDSTLYLEASGFQVNSRQFQPATYFQQHRKISGDQDGDYANFSLFGDQHRALKRILAFSQQRKISVIFLSLPLTNTYLDAVRQKREAAFVVYMNDAAKHPNLGFYDLSRVWPNRNELFIDPSHVNRYGAALISWQFAKLITPYQLQRLASKTPKGKPETK
ncbi:MAG: hypothetical protein HC771_07320 [Synechococcales cyanobacterium CRU_2_2]|nr:hypothetical protein [Synechococcales cyanobacterium CRU_2_2]